MTDLELTKRCAEAMEIHVQLLSPSTGFPSCNHYVIPEMSEAPNQTYDPLHDDAQAMALVKKFNLEIRHNAEGNWWVMGNRSSEDSDDLNRAICECVAKCLKKD